MNNICLGFSKENTLLKLKIHFHTVQEFTSSASGFGAITSCLMELDKIFLLRYNHQVDQKKLLLARLGSGSACRSLYNGLVVWGKTDEVEESSDLYAVKYPDDEEIHPILKFQWLGFAHSRRQKSGKFYVGHGLMNTNPYAERRFQEARDNFVPLKEILKTNLKNLSQIRRTRSINASCDDDDERTCFYSNENRNVKVINKL